MSVDCLKVSLKLPNEHVRIQIVFEIDLEFSKTYEN
jgi:hypothetical protein